VVQLNYTDAHTNLQQAMRYPVNAHWKELKVLGREKGLVKEIQDGDLDDEDLGGANF
jgi:26S proteasome regulatory subunit N3